jgi:tRNA dimethylallyltransferase
MTERPIIPIIAGLTASGKSDLAMNVCDRFGGEIISADSMQIYRGLDIGTAKPSVEDRRKIAHHLLDILDPGERYSVANFARDARRAVQNILDKRKLPVVCGGSVQYTSALLEGLSFYPGTIPDKIKEKVAKRVRHEGFSHLLEELRRLDPDTGANLSESDERRIIRFFEVYEAEGKTRSEINRESRMIPAPFEFRAICLVPPAAVIYEKINARTEHMFQSGLIEECRMLCERYPAGNTDDIFQGIGYKWTYRYLTGEISRTEAIELTKRDTRRYAKRQRTWYRHHKGYVYFDSFAADFDGIKAVLSLFIDR